MSYPQVGQRGTGRRKSAIARVRLLPGTGTILINGKSVEEYLGNRTSLHVSVKQALVSAGVESQYTVLCKVEGGGKVGQSQAIRLGVARALAELNPDYARLMRVEGFLTRDARVKERKKYGLHKARKKPQYSKR
ncbi:MAG: 30S ribosomal protein S9 [Vampirovibrionales bacterium]|jgi:small subunit ribosomal protein S9|nr:30S ribosomal protein S9 [Vampirovibrionales bacterium]